MKFKKFLNNYNYYNIVNFHKYRLLDFILSKYYTKKKRILRNSFIPTKFLNRYLKSSLNFKQYLNIFFKRNLFAYSDDSKKESIINFLNKNDSDFIKRSLQKADKIINKEFAVYEKKYKFQDKINWHYSFFTDYYWPLINSSDIIIRPKDKIIDPNYVWDFNRHKSFMYLGFGFFITKNEKYAIEFKNLILDWIRNNPPLYGINWYSGLEVSLRLISWIFSLYFFNDSKLINERTFFKKIFSSMFQHAYFLRHCYLKRGKNHTVGELCGLYLFCKIFDKFQPIKKWEQVIFKKMKNQISLQTRSDGTNIEQSVNYHIFVLEFFSLFLILTRDKIKQEEISQIEKCYEFLLYIIKPNHKLPLIGDSSEISLLLLGDNLNNYYQHLLNLGVLLFERGDLKYITKKPSPIINLLFGSDIVDFYKNIETIEPIDKLKYFEKAGYIILRNNWTDTANYLFVDFGKFGAQNAGHSHSSITNFIFSYKGKDILIDSGTYTYNKSWKERNYFRNSRAHNILTINQKNQAKIKSWFLWKDKPKVKRRLYLDNNTIEFTCFHNGYKGFITKRRIITNKNLDNLTIIDSVNRIQGYNHLDLSKIDIYFHFGKEIKEINIKSSENDFIIDNELVFRISSNFKFNTTIEKTYFSPKYGVKYENQTLRIHLSNLSKKENKIEIKTEIYHLN